MHVHLTFIYKTNKQKQKKHLQKLYFHTSSKFSLNAHQYHDKIKVNIRKFQKVLLHPTSFVLYGRL